MTQVNSQPKILEVPGPPVTIRGRLGLQFSLAAVADRCWLVPLRGLPGSQVEARHRAGHPTGDQARTAHRAFLSGV